MNIWHRVAFSLLGLALVVAGCGDDDSSSSERVVTLLDATGETVLGQPLSYPGGEAAEITASILTLQPGEETGWHRHEAPLFAYILDGAITVDYGSAGTRTYTTGMALMEAQDISHNGMTEGDEPAQILVVNLGAEGVANTVSDG